MHPLERPVTFGLGPNITGEFYPVTVRNDLGVSKAGALYPSIPGSPSKEAQANGSNLSEDSRLVFAAYSSTATYTDNGHVYPLSLALNYIIKA